MVDLEGVLKRLETKDSFEASAALYILQARIQILLDQSTGLILWAGIDFADWKRTNIELYEDSTQPVNKVGIVSATAETADGKRKIGKYLSPTNDFTVTLDEPVDNAAVPPQDGSSPGEELPAYSNIIRLKRLPTEIEPALILQHQLMDGTVHTLSLELLRVIGKDSVHETALKKDLTTEKLKALTGEVTKITKFLTKWLSSQDKQNFDWKALIGYPIDEDKNVNFSIAELVNLLTINLDEVRKINDSYFEHDQWDLMEITAVEEAESLLRKLPKRLDGVVIEVNPAKT